MDKRNKVLDIAMNLNRIGNWAADDYFGKQKRINIFLGNTDKLLDEFDTQNLPINFKKTFAKFLINYNNFKKESQKDNLLWAEKMMTWGNILTHRSLLLNS